ncbi:MAG: insulinase family protein, partial [Myxococcales bacterium]|nr:insulinase family protein [Myxococcales bacterium]
MILLAASALAQEPAPEPASEPVAGPSAEFVRARRVVLKDGLQVVVVEQPSAPLVTLAMALDGGRAREPEPGVARAAAETWFLTSATPTTSVRRRYDRMGAVTEVDVTTDHTLFVSRVLVDVLPAALTLEWLRLTEPLAGVD